MLRTAGSRPNRTRHPAKQLAGGGQSVGCPPASLSSHLLFSRTNLRFSLNRRAACLLLCFVSSCALLHSLPRTVDSREPGRLPASSGPETTLRSSQRCLAILPAVYRSRYPPPLLHRQIQTRARVRTTDVSSGAIAVHGRMSRGCRWERSSAAELFETPSGAVTSRMVDSRARPSLCPPRPRRPTGLVAGRARSQRCRDLLPRPAAA